MFLVETDYVLMSFGGKIISFNMIDVIENSHHELSYDSQIISHGQRSLRGELVDRYINHSRTNEITTRNIATSIGLLRAEDAWYNKYKNNQKSEKELSKESV
jgi:radical SAM superfamily enzyme with C-terminal helix-hairpin-helix motif